MQRVSVARELRFGQQSSSVPNNYRCRTFPGFVRGARLNGGLSRGLEQVSNTSYRKKLGRLPFIFDIESVSLQ